MKLKEIEWKTDPHDALASTAYIGIKGVGNVFYTGQKDREIVAECYLPGQPSFVGYYHAESEAKAAVESKIKEWFNQVTE